MTQTAIFDDFSTLADPIRSRMLLVLDRNELTVSELCAVVQLPQSTVSRHLKTLLDAGWVTSRREGTSRFYTLAYEGRGGHASMPQQTRDPVPVVGVMGYTFPVENATIRDVA